MPAIFTVWPGIGLEIAGMARSHGNIARKWHQHQVNNLVGVHS